jgi:RNA polymerase sigma-70 factor, ECF subfamily
MAEDLTQSTFEKAWKARSRYRHDLGAFTTWLLTIAGRTLTDTSHAAYAVAVSGTS